MLKVYYLHSDEAQRLAALNQLADRLELAAVVPTAQRLVVGGDAAHLLARVA